MQVQKNGRQFAGPYLIYGLLPNWPKELERRQGFSGPHSSLTDLQPLRVDRSFFPTHMIQPPKEPAKKGESLIGGTVSDRYLVRASPKMQRDIKEAEMLLKKHTLTAKGMMKRLKISSPTAYAVLEGVRRKAGAKMVEGHKGRAKAWRIR